jgi:hypothetical protein
VLGVENLVIFPCKSFVRLWPIRDEVFVRKVGIVFFLGCVSLISYNLLPIKYSLNPQLLKRSALNMKLWSGLRLKWEFYQLFLIEFVCKPIFRVFEVLDFALKMLIFLISAKARRIVSVVYSKYIKLAWYLAFFGSLLKRLCQLEDKGLSVI